MCTLISAKAMSSMKNDPKFFLLLPPRCSLEELLKVFSNLSWFKA